MRTALGLAVALGLVAGGARAEKSAAERVADAQRSGALSAERAAFWDVVAAFAPERLPSALSGDRARAPRELSLALRNARLAADRLPPSERALLASLLLRPTDPGDPFGYSVAEEPPHCTENFCIHYVSSTSDAPPPDDFDQSGIPDAVENTAAKLELARAALIALGYSYHGVDDAGLGGDTRTDVYIKDVGFEFTAAVVPEDVKEFTPLRLSSYVIINTMAYTLPEEYFEGTLSHELKHTFDAATFGNAPSWLFESSAVWVENEVNDADTAHTVFFPCWFTFPEFSVDVTRDDFYPAVGKDPGNCGAAPYHIYGSAAFWFHLGAELGADVNRQVWDQGGLDCPPSNDPDSAESRRCVADTIAKIASAGGKDLGAMFLDFSVKNYVPQKSSVLLSVESGGELFAWPDGPHIETQHASYPVQGEGTVDHWASRYYELAPLSTGPRPLEVTVDGPDGKPFGATLITTANDTLQEQPIPLDDDNRGALTIESFGGSVKRVALVITNPAPIETDESSDDLAFSYAATLGEGASGAGGGSGSGGSGGVGGGAGGGAAGASGSNAAPQASDDEGGCGCRTPRSAPESALAPLALLALGAAWWRRRRRRRGCSV